MKNSAALWPVSHPYAPLAFTRCNTARIDIKAEGAAGNDLEFLSLFGRTAFWPLYTD